MRLPEIIAKLRQCLDHMFPSHRYRLMRLSDIAWEELRIGWAVVSPKGTVGEISELLDDSKGSFRDQDRCFVTIKWENGNISRQPHFLLDTVTLF